MSGHTLLKVEYRYKAQWYMVDNANIRENEDVDRRYGRYRRHKKIITFQLRSFVPTGSLDLLSLRYKTPR